VPTLRDDVRRPARERGCSRAARAGQPGRPGHGQALTLRYYRDAGLARWVATPWPRSGIDAAGRLLVVDGAVRDRPRRPAALVDFVDVDSAKWTEYAAATLADVLAVPARRPAACWPTSAKWLAPRHARSSSPPAETELFRRLAPECGPRGLPMPTASTPSFFAPDPQRVSPFRRASRRSSSPARWTTGPTSTPSPGSSPSDAARAAAPPPPGALPHRRACNPAPAVRALCERPGVNVTGTVADVRPYLAACGSGRGAAAAWRAASRTRCWRPWRWAVPVVTTPSCAQAIAARDGVELVCADGAAQWVAEVDRCLGDARACGALGRAAREQVLRAYSWQAHLSAFDRHLAAAPSTPAATAAGQVAELPA
jgi:hypothetical protein